MVCTRLFLAVSFVPKRIALGSMNLDVIYYYAFSAHVAGGAKLSAHLTRSRRTSIAPRDSVSYSHLLQTRLVAESLCHA